MTVKGLVGLISVAALYYLGHAAYQQHLGEAAETLLRENGFEGVHVESVGLPLSAIFASKADVTLVIKSGSELLTVTMDVVGSPLQSQIIEISGDQILKLRAHKFVGNLLQPKGPARARTEEEEAVQYVVSQGEGLFDKKLHAFVGGRKYPILPKSDECIDLLQEGDFDQDGYKDALILYVAACGGNGAANSVGFVSYQGKGTFAVTKTFGYTWDNPEAIHKTDGTWEFLVQSNNMGVNNEPLRESTERIALQHGKGVVLEKAEKQPMKALVEINSSEFEFDSADGEQEKSLSIDLDGNGRPDTIVYSFWERWGSLLWKIHFDDGREVDLKTGARRVGILSAKTNGYHDIVMDNDYVIRWNGQTYAGDGENTEK